MKRKPKSGDAVPAGWGFKPQTEEAESKEVQKGAGDSGQIWEFAPGTNAHLEPPMLQFVGIEFMEFVRLYEAHGDLRHLWRAWRCARTLGEVPPEFLRVIAPHFDKLSEVAFDATRLTGTREREVFIRRSYDFLMGRVKEAKSEGGRPFRLSSKQQVYEELAGQYESTPDAIKQIILRHEGRGQRGK